MNAEKAGYYATDYLLAVEGLSVSFDGFKAVSYTHLTLPTKA